MTQTAKHTPGPWHIFTTLNGVPIISSVRGAVAVTRATENNAGGIEKANARLIAAAPELLAALKYARTCIAYCRRRHPDAQKGDGIPAEVFIDAAIAKAEGKQP